MVEVTPFSTTESGSNQIRSVSLSIAAGFAEASSSLTSPFLLCTRDRWRLFQPLIPADSTDSPY